MGVEPEEIGAEMRLGEGEGELGEGVGDVHGGGSGVGDEV